MRSLRPLIFVILATLMSATAFGAGYSIFEQGAKASGMAGAFAATADDPSAIFYNPAGLAQQREMAVLTGATFINFSNEFTGDPNSPVTSGVDGKYNHHTFIPLNAYAILPLGNNITVGFGAFAAWGLRTDWQNPWPGRYISRDADLRTKSFQPTIAWQNDTGSLAVGGGIEYRQARVFLNSNIFLPFPNPFTGRIADIGTARLASDGYDSAIGYNVGVLWKPAGRFRVGASYRSDMDIDVEGDADFTQISTGNAQLDALVAQTFPRDDKITATVPFPAVIAVGVAFSPNDRWDIEFDITHMTWSAFESLDVDFEQQTARSFSREQNWDDSSCYRLGANVKASENWEVRLGGLYDQNPQPVEAVSPLLPDSDRIGATFGVGFKHGPWIADIAAFVLHFKDRSTEGVNPDQFEGVYETDAVLWSVNFGYRF